MQLTAKRSPARPLKLDGGLRGRRKRKPRLRRERKNVNSARVDEALFDALHNYERLHHRFSEPKSKCTFFAPAHQYIPTLGRDKFSQVLLKRIYFYRRVAFQNCR